MKEKPTDDPIISERDPLYMNNAVIADALANLVIRNGGDGAMEVPSGSDLWHFPHFTDKDIDDLRTASQQVEKAS